MDGELIREERRSVLLVSNVTNGSARLFATYTNLSQKLTQRSEYVTLFFFLQSTLKHLICLRALFFEVKVAQKFPALRF